MPVKGAWQSNQKTGFPYDSKLTQKPYLCLAGCAADTSNINENRKSCNFCWNFQILLLITEDNPLQKTGT